MSSRPRIPSYRAVLGTPDACRVFGAALLGRLSYGIVPLSLVLALTRATGSYAVAGGVMALFALTVSVLAPVRAGLIDKYGPLRAVAAALGIGVYLGSVELLMVAFAKQHHHAAAVAWCSASLSAGSAFGGLVHGSLPWRISGRARLPVLVTVPALGLALAGLSPNVHVLAVVAGATGLFISPALATAYLIADESAAQSARTRAGAWVNTAVNGGSSGGTAASGLLLGRLPLAACFAVTALPVLLAAVTALILPISTRAAGTSWRMPRDRTAR